MQTKIIQLLVSVIIFSEKVNQVFEIYRASPSKNLSTERYLNQAGFSKDNLEMLTYEIKNL